MRIAIDIGHPAHVHYFKHFIWEMQRKGHDFLISARNRGLIFELLDSYGFSYLDRGTGSNTQLGKIVYLPQADYVIYKAARRFNPDMFLSFGSMYAAHVSKLLRKPHVAFDDTEFSRKEYLLYAPFTDAIFTPNWFSRELGPKKHYRFNGFMELCYLHPNWFEVDSNILNDLKIVNKEKYVVVRFNEFKAIHDSGVTGFTSSNRKRLVQILSKYAKVFVSSEGETPGELEPYRLKTAAKKIHNVIYCATLFIGESGTMATEAACLGTPSIRCHSFANTLYERANFVQLSEEFNLLFNYNPVEQDAAIQKAVELVKRDARHADFNKKYNSLLNSTIDVTSFMVWMVENYPGSLARLRIDPGFQNKFRNISLERDE